MGDGVNIAARLEGVAAPGAICLSEDAYRQVIGRLDMEVTDLGPTQLKNIERSIRVYSLQVGVPAEAKPVPSGPLAPKMRSPLARLAAGVAALLIVLAGGASWLLGAYRPTIVRQQRPRRLLRTQRRLLKPSICPSSCCRSPISQTTRARTISPTDLQRT